MQRSLHTWSKILFQLTSTLPSGIPFVLFSLREKNCMMGIISSRLLGMLSPDLRYRFISTVSKTCLSFSSELEVTEDASEPAHTSTGALFLGFRDAGTSPGRAPPTLITPPSSADAAAGADW